MVKLERSESRGSLPVYILGCHKYLYQTFNSGLTCLRQNKHRKALGIFHSVFLSSRNLPLKCVSLYAMGSCYIDSFDAREQALRCLSCAEELLSRQNRQQESIVTATLRAVTLEPLAQNLEYCRTRIINMRENFSENVDKEDGFGNWEFSSELTQSVCLSDVLSREFDVLDDVLERGLEYSRAGEVEDTIHLYLAELADLQKTNITLTRYDILHLVLLIAQAYKQSRQIMLSISFLHKALTLINTPISHYNYDIVLAENNSDNLGHFKTKLNREIERIVTNQLSELQRTAEVLDVELRYQKMMRAALKKHPADQIATRLNIITMFIDKFALRDAENELRVVSDLSMDIPRGYKNDKIKPLHEKVQVDIDLAITKLTNEFELKNSYAVARGLLDGFLEENRATPIKKKRDVFIEHRVAREVENLDKAEQIIYMVLKQTNSSILKSMCYHQLARLENQLGKFATAKFHCRLGIQLCTKFVIDIPDTDLSTLLTNLKALHKTCSQTLAVVEHTVQLFGRAARYSTQELMELALRPCTPGDLESVRSEIVGLQREKRLSLVQEVASPTDVVPTNRRVSFAVDCDKDADAVAKTKIFLPENDVRKFMANSDTYDYMLTNVFNKPTIEYDKPCESWHKSWLIRDMFIFSKSVLSDSGGVVVSGDRLIYTKSDGISLFLWAENKDTFTGGLLNSLGVGVGMRISNDTKKKAKELRALKTGTTPVYRELSSCKVWIAGNCGDAKVLKHVERMLYKLNIQSYNKLLYDNVPSGCYVGLDCFTGNVVVGSLAEEGDREDSTCSQISDVSSGVGVEALDEVVSER